MLGIAPAADTHDTLAPAIAAEEDEAIFAHTFDGSADFHEGGTGGVGVGTDESGGFNIASRGWSDRKR